MDLEQEKIISTLSREKKSLMIKDIAELSGINRHMVARKLDILEILGRVRKIEIGHAKKYSLVEAVPVTSLIDISNDLIIILNDKWEVQYMNKYALVFFNLTDQSVDGKLMDLLHLDIFSLPEVIQGLKEYSFQKVSKIEVKINKNGSDHWYEISIMNIVLRPASVFIAAIASNVTDKIETRKQLLESEAMYRSLFEKAQIPINESDYSLYIDLLNATGVPMIIWDSSLVITWVSDGLNVLCGYSGSYLQGKNLNLICCEKEIITQITRFSAQMNEQNGFFEIPVLHQSGRIKHVRWYSINKVRASDGKEKYAAIVREISPYPVF